MGYEEIKSESKGYFEFFRGLQKAVQNPQKTKIEETISGAYWLGILDEDSPFLGPPRRFSGKPLDWNKDKDLVKFSVYRAIVSGD